MSWHFSAAFLALLDVSKPDAFKTTLTRGSRFKAGAFSVIRDRGQAYVVQEFESGISNKNAKERYQRQLAPGATLGAKFPEKLHILEFHNFSKTVAPFFTDAEILVDKGGVATLRNNRGGSFAG